MESEKTTILGNSGPASLEGLFGGTFNPLHNGHIQVVQHVRSAFGLNRVHLIPSANPPHKPPVDLAPAEARFEMIQRAIKGIPGFAASDVELKRKGLSFTIDTVTYFKETAAHGTRLFLIMGTDAFLDIGTWKKTHAIFSEISLIVMLRAGHEQSLNTIASFMKDVVSGSYRFDTASDTFIHPELEPVSICRVPQVNLSSTDIRNRIKQHRPIHGLVPDPVETIIADKGLYL